VRKVGLSSKGVAVDLLERSPYVPDMSEFVALIELGSNAVRCLLTSVAPGIGFQVLLEEREQTRLGGGLPGHLPPLAVQKTVSAVRRFLRRVQAQYHPRVLAVATSAVREANNRGDLLSRLKREADIDVRVLSGVEEASLGARAALWSLSLQQSTVADLGGGSLQLTQVREGTIVSAASVPLGAVRMTARFFRNDPATKQEVQALRHEIQRHCEPILPSIATSEGMVGMGGTIRTLGRMHLLASNRQRSRQGLILQQADVTVLREHLQEVSVRERARIPGLKEERADIIFAGAVVVEEVMRLGCYRTLTVCTDGVRQGLLLHEAFDR
jgi:exopolyphosphatase/guanosine-5'-triphosphate,3'-diphosphate pyrophosphatase